MKDVTSTSFGILIAYVLPGFAAFYSLSFWSSTVADIFKTFLTANSNVGLFFLVFAAAIIIGLQVTIIRWVLFETWYCKAHELTPDFFKELGKSEHRLTAFRTIVDENYRYHQFFGGMFVAILMFVIGWIWQKWPINLNWQSFLLIVFVVAVETLNFCAAVAAYVRYTSRAEEILKSSSSSR